MIDCRSLCISLSSDRESPELLRTSMHLPLKALGTGLSAFFHNSNSIFSLTLVANIEPCILGALHGTKDLTSAPMAIYFDR